MEEKKREKKVVDDSLFRLLIDFCLAFHVERSSLIRVHTAGQPAVI